MGSPIGEIWFAWTCLPPVHWIVPILAGIPFGAGNTAVFIYGVNYLAQSYGSRCSFELYLQVLMTTKADMRIPTVYSASALAGNALIRSLFGGGLPLAGPKMYATLNAHWAGTLLGLLQVALIPIPVVFYKYGHKIRMKSALIKEMQQELERLENRRAPKLRANDVENTANCD